MIEKITMGAVAVMCVAIAIGIVYDIVTDWFFGDWDDWNDRRSL